MSSRKKGYLRALLTAGLLAAVSSPAEEPRIYRVAGDTTGGTATGDSWKNAFSNLQQAINAAVREGGGEIWVKAGLYKPEGNGRDSTFELRPGIRLYGGFRGTEENREERNPRAYRTTLNGDLGLNGNDEDNSYHVLTLTTDTLLDGFTVSRGNANGLAQKEVGGGMTIMENASKVFVMNCTFEKNSASWQGGAIYGESVGLVISNCTFSANSAGNGGAVAIRKASTVSVTDSVFSSNTAATSGGAVNLEDDTAAELLRCSFNYNSSAGQAGALAARMGKEEPMTLSIRACRFSDNLANVDGGALFLSGPFTPILLDCTFERNSAYKGAGAVSIEADALTVIQACTFTFNRGREDRPDVGTDETAMMLDSLEALLALAPPEPEEQAPEPPPARQLVDAVVYDLENVETPLRSLVSGKTCSLLALGDLTDPDFIEHYRIIEAAARDYASFDVQFFYIYRALRHPENHGYLQPFIIQERIRQAQIARTRLLTRVPWLCDGMNNQVTLSLTEGRDFNVFLFSSDGEERYAGSLENRTALLNALNNIVGEPPTRTALNAMDKPDIQPLEIAPPNLLDRTRFNPNTDPFFPLRIMPIASQSPFYVKLRAEGNGRLLQSGNGRLYLGFHMDPLYEAQWDNNASPLTYTLQTVSGTVAPASDSAPVIRLARYDTEPREFTLSTRRLDLSNPLMLQVDYTVYLPRPGRSVNISQRYAIYMERDPLGGDAYRRQIAYQDPPRRSTRVTMPGDLREYDTNGDRQISRQELSGNLWSRFPDMDTNKDGFLSAEEYQAYLNSR